MSNARGKKSKVKIEYDIYECMLLKNIKHGKTYSSCEFYPEADEAYEPGYVKVNIETNEVVEQRGSKYPIWHGRYAHYAKQEIVSLRVDRNHCKQKLVEWVKNKSSDF